LDLSGSGNTEEEAKNSFEIVLSEYFKYTQHKKTLARILKAWMALKKESQ